MEGNGDASNQSEDLNRRWYLLRISNVFSQSASDVIRLVGLTFPYGMRKTYGANQSRATVAAKDLFRMKQRLN